MMLIEENLYTEGQNPQAQRLTHCLKEFHDRDPFSNGLDWSKQTLWAKMTDEQCIMFCLKYPQYAGRFKPV